MYCPNCKQEFDGKFCPECGTKLIEKTTRMCPNCKVEVESKFCPECGAKTVEVVEKMVKMCPNCKVETESKFCPECGAKIVEMAVKATATGEIVAAGQQEDAETCYRTAQDYYYGKNGKNKDDEAAAQWYLNAAEQGHVESYYCLGSMLKEVCELEDAIGCFQEAAELGHAAAQYELGVAYSLGLGIEQNNEESMKWYRKAAEQGHEEAIGFLEELGERVPAKQDSTANTEKAAERGNEEAKEHMREINDNTKNMEKSKFRVELSVRGSYGFEVGWIDTDEYDVDSMTKDDARRIDTEGVFSAGFSPEMDIDFELTVYDENDCIVYASDDAKEFPLVASIEDLKEIPFFEDKAEEIIQTCEYIKEKDIQWVAEGTYVVSLCEKKWMIYEFEICDENFDPGKLFFWPDFSAGRIMGGLVTTPSRIFYNDSFVEEEDITNTEESLGSTLALAKVDDSGNWEVLNKFDDDDDEEWSDDEGWDEECGDDEACPFEIVDGEVIIPEGTTEIPDKVFYNNDEITSVVIPEGVTNIGFQAFCGTSLASIVIPESVTEIGGEAFWGCEFTSIVIPEGVTEIPKGAFEECDSLASIIIPKSVTKIGERAFYNCTSLSSVVIPESVTEIGPNAFGKCESLTSIVIPDNVTKIGYDAFYGCGFTSINIPKSMTTIGEQAFEGCSNLISIIIPESVAVIEALAFKECDNLTSVTILNGEIRYNDSPDEIFDPDDIFDECPSLEHIYVPAGTTAHFKEIFGEGLHKFITEIDSEPAP